MLQLLERRLERPDPLQLDLRHAQLVLPARLIHRHVALQRNLPPVLQQRTIHLRFPSKQHAVQLRPDVLEREIDVPGALAAQVRHFARHPNLADLLFQQPLDLPRQFSDGQHFARLFPGEQLAELPL